MTSKADDVKLPPIADLVLAKSKGAFSNQMKQLFEALNCLFIFDYYGLLVI